jgi:drug/metabolite transporter (DMT)-like permease
MVWGAGLFFGAMFSTYQHGLIAGDVVRVTLLFYLAPVWGTVLGMVFLGTRFSLRRMVVVVLGFAGAAVILDFEGGVPSPRGLGEWMGLASGITFAVGATFAHKVVGDYELEKVWLSLAFGAVLSTAFALVNPVFPIPSADQAFAAAPFAVSVVVVILIPITWIMVWGAQRLDPGRLSLLLMLEVVAASVTSALLAGEPYGIEKLIGTTMILTAGAVEALADRRA